MIILASQSPRRAELLRQVGIAFEICVADVDEGVRSGEAPPDYVRRVALAKAEAVHAHVPSLPVLAADTAVVIDGRILGKPDDRADALAMLAQLSGRTHEVLSGVALLADKPAYRLSISRVSFRPISPGEAAAYWTTGEPADKAGAYAVQGLAAAFIERIEGSYSGIMGLPLFETLEMLRGAGLRGVFDINSPDE
jgi:septum formation protein